MNVVLHPRQLLHAEADRRRRTIRYVAATASAVTALLYFGIGAGVLKVVNEVSAAAPNLFDFGVMAGSAFVLGAILLIAFDRRVMWVLGAVFQVGVIVMYVAIAPQRTPSFEIWGITIKILQAAILALLLYLVVTPRAARTEQR